MGRKIGAKRRESLIQDIFNAEHDVVALAHTHGLSPDELASWASSAENQQCLTGLCVLADIQTQLLLSRYRLLAATRLIRLATQEDESASADVARKACVDLLRLDLKRAEAKDANDEADEPTDDPGALRAMLYGTAEAGADDDENANAGE